MLMHAIDGNTSTMPFTAPPFGRKTNKTADWFESHSEVMTPVIGEKRRALAAYKACPSKRNLQVLRAARSKVQQTARRCANDYWLQLCSQIRSAADTGNIKGMYDGINCPSEVRHRRDHPRSGEADGTLGAALLRVIL